jgi:hypothetical protein
MSWHLSSHRVLKRELLRRKSLKRRKLIFLRKKPLSLKPLKMKLLSQRNKKSKTWLDWKNRMMRSKPQLRRTQMSSQRTTAHRLLMRSKKNPQRKIRRTKRIRKRIKKKHQQKRIQLRNLMKKMMSNLSSWREEKVTRMIVMKMDGSSQKQLRKQSKSQFKKQNNQLLKRLQVCNNRREKNSKPSILVSWPACLTKREQVVPKKLHRHNH